jgi:excisionase family DNA binding protein
VTERLLTARELADLLGLSPSTVLDRFEAGDLPGFRLYGGRVGAPVRFRWSEVEEMLERGRHGPRGTACTLTNTRVYEKLQG